MATDNQSYTYNAYQSNLAGPLVSGLFNVILDYIPPGLGVPAYLVIDPDVPAAREYIKVLAYTGNTIDNMERNLEGSAGDVDHAVGAIIRAVYTMQHLDDTFFDIGANADALVAHAGDPGDPHNAADYAKNSYVDQQDALYLPLAGGVVTGATEFQSNLFTLSGLSPTGVSGNAPNVWMDANGRLFEHTNPQGVTDALYVKLAGDTMTGNLIISRVAANSLIGTWNDNQAGIEFRDAAGSETHRFSLFKEGTLLNLFSNAFGGNLQTWDATGIGIFGLINMNDNKIINLADPTNPDDAIPLSFGDARYLRLTGGTMTGPVLFPVGSAATPSIQVGSANTGFYRPSPSVLGFVSNGAVRLNLQSDGNFSGPGTYLVSTGMLIRPGLGSLASPTYSFNNDPDTGIYRSASNTLSFASGGQDAGLVTFATTRFPPVYNGTTGTTVNVAVETNGNLKRSTSARKYKSDVKENPVGLADLSLTPVSFHHDGDDIDYIGFVADDMPDERAIVRGDDGDVENYDVRAVVAILAAKVNRLESV